MAKKLYIDYSKCCKPKDDVHTIPEYLVYMLRNKNNKTHVDYTNFYKNKSI